MSAILIDGKAFAERLVGNVGVAVEELSNTHSFKPGLAVVLVGENPASEVYVKNKVRQTNNSGMVSIEHRLPEETTEEDLLSLVKDQKVDILKIKILPLAEQYLKFLKKIIKNDLEIAAEYLVVGSILAFIKSRELLPKDDLLVPIEF